MKKTIIEKWNIFANGKSENEIKYGMFNFISELEDNEKYELLLNSFINEKEAIKFCQKCNHFHKEGDKCGDVSLILNLMNNNIILHNYYINKGFFIDNIILPAETIENYKKMNYNVFNYIKIPETEDMNETILFNTQYEDFLNVNNIKGEDVFFNRNGKRESIQSISIVNNNIEILLLQGNVVISSFNDFYFDGKTNIYLK